MMLEFAMRNGDVLRLRPENFVERSGEVKVNKGRLVIICVMCRIRRH